MAENEKPKVKMLATDGTAGGAEAGATEGHRFWVDGKAVSEGEWRKAASEQYDLARMPENYFPAISTKKHGE